MVSFARYDVAPMDPAADARLAQRLAERDQSALREAISAYGRIVHGMARRVLSEASLAEEVAQDTFLALWRRPPPSIRSAALCSRFSWVLLGTRRSTSYVERNRCGAPETR
jgi:hypothetical protein